MIGLTRDWTDSVDVLLVDTRLKLIVAVLTCLSGSLYQFVGGIVPPEFRIGFFTYNKKENYPP